MSVIVTMKVAGDTQKFREFVANRGDEMRRIADEARSRGCRAHRFGVGDGYVLVIDEWDSSEEFQEFFQSPDIAEVMQQSGAQGEPQITFAEAIETPDQF